MKILAIDPSSKPKNRGYSLWKDGVELYYGPILPPAHMLFGLDLAAVEDQWANPKASRQSLITLGQIAGFLLGRVDAARYVAVPVATWKNQVIPGFGNAKKQIYTANLRQMWPETVPLHPVGSKEEDPASDILDARGLGRSFWARGVLAYTEKQLKSWELK